MSTTIRPFAVQAGEGVVLRTPTSDVTVKADTARTNGAMTVLELVIEPREGPARHTHLREDELWYVLDGEFRFEAGGVKFRASTGGMAFGPRAMPHAFQNLGDTAGRLLVITTPSGVERFFEELDELMPGPVSPETFAALGRAHGVEFDGPPLAVSDPL